MGPVHIFHSVRTTLMRTFLFGSNTLSPLLEIVADSGGSTSCDTQLNCRTLFTIATALLSPPFFGLLFFVLQSSSAETSTLCRIHIPILTYRLDIREDANSHKVISYNYLSRSICTAVN